MAFFSNEKGKNYFGIFYFLEKNNSKTGFFHELSVDQIIFLKKCYKLSSFFVFINFILEIFFFLASQVLGYGWYCDAWKFHLLATPIPLLFLAIFICNKPKVNLQSVEMNILPSASKSVYLTIIFSFLSMVMTFLWMGISGILIDGIFIWIFFFLSVSIFCGIRIVKMKKI